MHILSNEGLNSDLKPKYLKTKDTAMTRTKNAQASKPSIRPLVAPVPVHLELARMAFLAAATITLLVLVDLAHSYCVEGPV